MKPQSRGEMTHHEMLFVDFAKYYEEIISDERQEEIEAKLYEDKVLTAKERDEVYKNMFQAYMDELYSLVRKGKDCIKRQPPFIISLHKERLDANGNLIPPLLD